MERRAEAQAVTVAKIALEHHNAARPGRQLLAAWSAALQRKRLVVAKIALEHHNAARPGSRVRDGYYSQCGAW